jgi:ribosomal protein L37AE/L43A
MAFVVERKYKAVCDLCGMTNETREPSGWWKCEKYPKLGLAVENEAIAICFSCFALILKQVEKRKGDEHA